MAETIRQGVKWTTLLNIFIFAAGLLRVAILVRYLEKADFGLMALANFVIGMTTLFMGMGITTAILHKQDITKQEYASLYWLNVFFSLLLYGMIFLLAIPIGEFYEETELASIIRLVGLGLIISAVGRQFKTVNQKHFAFKRLALVEMAAVLVSLIVGVVLAVQGWRVQALVWSTIANYAVSNAAFFLMGVRENGLLFHFAWGDTKPFLKIGLWEVMGQVINQFNRDIDVLLIGKLLGTEVLGGYSLAKQLAQKPMTLLNPIVTSVATPYLAKLQATKEELKTNFLKILNMVASINLPVYLALALLAEPVVRIYYGSEQLDIVPIVRVLCGYMYFRAIINPSGSLLVATGRTDLNFYWNLLLLGAFPVFVYAGHFSGAVGVAYGLLALIVVMFVPTWKILIALPSGATLGEYVGALVPDWRLIRLVLNRSAKP
ncbi:MOP flippase family protein [Neolewinella lacunae]|uniref:MOP flippase family protein n=1 Tax=Neolewinella lacunae TaxID=1517758 RepID=A0A923PIY9_9BACT|nr:MOP flippase family protein [Neolewinella lacunae]MBC6994169.1 MOP flippase family protein [Neolewinella lacunae]MDN3636682.1 MOP flippase family protein [Neolewinella lacunae]